MIEIFMMLALAAITTPALAGVIYSWEDLDPPNGTVATGSVTFNNVDFFDLEVDVTDFSFTTRGGQTFGTEFAWEALAGVDVGGGFLCFSCERKAAKKKTVGNIGFFDAVDATGELIPTIMGWQTGGRKKATKKDGEPVVDPFESGTGRWVLVRVPEPQALLLLFTGLALVGLIRRRRVGRLTSASWTCSGTTGEHEIAIVNVGNGQHLNIWRATGGFIVSDRALTSC